MIDNKILQYCSSKLASEKTMGELTIHPRVLERHPQLTEEDVELVDGVEPGDWYWYIDENYFRYNPDDSTDLETDEQNLLDTTPELYTAIRLKKWKEWIPGKWIDEHDPLGLTFNEDGTGMYRFTSATWTINKNAVEMHYIGQDFSAGQKIDKEVIDGFKDIDNCGIDSGGMLYRYKD